MFEFSDLFTIALLVLLEGILSADNALVLAVLVLPLPPAEQRRALQYGIVGAIVLRTIACIFAAMLIQAAWMKLLGGLYLLHLAYKHFRSHPDSTVDKPREIALLFGLSAFWSTVVRVELTDLVFAVDSILMAVGMSDKFWVIITGGILGILAIRLLTGSLLSIIKKYPALIDGAYVIIAWIGTKLFLEYLHTMGWSPIVIPKFVSLTVVVVLFVGSYFWARSRPAVMHGESDAAAEVEKLLH